MKRMGIILGVLGSIIGVVSAISAFVAVGGDAAYSARLWAGWAALVLAVLAGAAAPLMSTRPVAAGLIMLVSGFAGFVCINLFYINTFYGLALPLWIAGAVLIIISSRRIEQGTEKRES